MGADDVTVTEGLAAEHVEDALRILYGAFAKKLRIGFRDAEDYVRLFRDGVNPAACLSATADGELLGILALQWTGVELYAFRPRTLFRRFSPLRAVLILINMLLFYSPPKQGVLVVDQLAVAPSARGKGVGTLLLEAAEARGRAMGVPMMALSVISENEGAIRLYERMGYVRTQAVGGSLVRMVVKSAEVWRMEKVLG